MFKTIGEGEGRGRGIGVGAGGGEGLEVIIRSSGNFIGLFLGLLRPRMLCLSTIHSLGLN